MLFGLEWYKWLSIIGVPSIAGIATHMIAMGRRVKILMKAQQADMRHELLNDYHMYMDQGWMTDDEQTDWENRYQAYHALGKNGVLDAKRKDILALPNKPHVPSV